MKGKGHEGEWKGIFAWGRVSDGTETGAGGGPERNANMEAMTRWRDNEVEARREAHPAEILVPWLCSQRAPACVHVCMCIFDGLHSISDGISLRGLQGIPTWARQAASQRHARPTPQSRARPGFFAIRCLQTQIHHPLPSTFYTNHGLFPIHSRFMLSSGTNRNMHLSSTRCED